MTTGEPKMTEMSKPAEILYRAFFDELRFAKQQQWTITNYLLLLMGAGFGLFKVTSPSPTQCEKVVWSALAAGVVMIGVFLLLHLQHHMHTTRARQWRMEETFSPEDQSLARNKPPAVRPDGRGPIEWLSRWPWLHRVVARWLPDGRGPMELFVVVLCGVVIVAGILAGYAIWRQP
jgi:hypothetical protein